MAAEVDATGPEKRGEVGSGGPREGFDEIPFRGGAEAVLLCVALQAHGEGFFLDLVREVSVESGAVEVRG